MSFINTRDTIGDATTVDGLVDHSLTELADDGVYTVESYACYSNNGLQTVKLPNVQTINQYAFGYDTELISVELGGESSTSSLTISANSFNGCTKLTHFVIDRPSVATLSSTNAFTGTKLDTEEGAIYVPSSLISSYKSNTNWSKYLIFDKSRYPVTNFDIISDSWATILADTNPESHYSIGDTKTLVFNNNNLLVQIVGFGLDTIASDNTKRAAITWIIKKAYGSSTLSLNNSYPFSGGWANSSIRSWLISTILPLLEASDVGQSLQTVTKTSLSKYPSSETLSSEDKIWIPSYKEVGFTNSAYMESDGVVYPYFNDTTRVKINSAGSACYWWLRSGADSAGRYSYVHSSGIHNYAYSTSGYSVVFGFCTGVIDAPSS